MKKFLRRLRPFLINDTYYTRTFLAHAAKMRGTSAGDRADGCTRRDLTRFVALLFLLGVLVLRRFMPSSDIDFDSIVAPSTDRRLRLMPDERARPAPRISAAGRAKGAAAATRATAASPPEPDPEPEPEPEPELAELPELPELALQSEPPPPLPQTEPPISPQSLPDWLSSLPPAVAGEWEVPAADGGVRRCRWPAALAADESAPLVVEAGGVLHARPLAPPALVAAAVAALRARCGAPLRAFATYSDDVYERARRRLVGEASASGEFDVVLELTPGDLDDAFRAANAATLAIERGGGLWLWKPWVASRALALLADGDFLVYFDAGCKLKHSLEPWFALAAANDPGWVVFEFDEGIPTWTKGDTYAALGLTTDAFVDKLQVLGGIWVMRKTPTTARLAAEWLRVSQLPGVITDDPSVTPNPGGFVDHRHDQSVFSLLVRMFDVQTVVKDESYPEDHAERLMWPVIAARSRD